VAIVEINTDPTRRDLRWFGILLLAFCGLVGGMIQWRLQAPTAARWVWGAGAVLAAVYYAIPPVRKPIFVGWMCAAFPVGWVISHLVLGIVYYLVMTPIGLIMRLAGRDPLHRRPDPDTETYWREHDPHKTPDRYFRQF